MSVTAGTIFRTLTAADPLVPRPVADHQPEERHQRSGPTAVLGLGSYKTAWAMLHKLRRAMVRPGRDPLAGVVEVDEAYWGGEETGATGRQTELKTRIIVAAEEDGNGIGRIRLRTIPDVSKASLHGFIRRPLQPGSTVRTDGWPAYLGLLVTSMIARCRAINRRGTPASARIA